MKSRISILACLLVLAGAEFCAALEAPSNSVRFQVWSADSVALVSGYYPTTDAGGPVTLMLHDRGGQGSDLADLARHFMLAGLPVFLPDLRGEGESVVSVRGTVPPAEEWGPRERRTLKKDLKRVLDFADQQGILAERPWVIVAVGEACALALELLREEERFAKLVLLSPVLPADPSPANGGSGKPVLLLACDEDPEAVAILRELYERLPPATRRMDLLPCRARGARMLRWVEGLDERLADWAARGGDRP